MRISLLLLFLSLPSWAIEFSLEDFYAKLAHAPDERIAAKVIEHYGSLTNDPIADLLKMPLEEIDALPEHSILAVFKHSKTPIIHWLPSEHFSTPRWNKRVALILQHDLKKLDENLPAIDILNRYLYHPLTGLLVMGVVYVLPPPNVPPGIIGQLAFSLSYIARGLGFSLGTIPFLHLVNIHWNKYKFRLYKKEIRKFLEFHPEIELKNKEEPIVVCEIDEKKTKQGMCANKDYFRNRAFA